ncbi:hypothetical protein [Amycolatopsis thermoflava]|uniref:hypothetical protein n=1 Tax=Amycolatopsis thermoflava TaxID=84480 RepID=UPI0038003E04
MTIRIPAPSSMLLANLLGVLGLVAVVVAVGGLAGWWWAVLAGGLVGVGLSVIALSNLAADEPAGAAAAAPVARLGEQRSA